MRLRMAILALSVMVMLSPPSVAGEGSLPGYVSVTTGEVKELLAGDLGDDLVLLDVRQQDEYREGHLEGAILIPLSQLEARLSEIDRDKTILVVCWSGYRSARAASILADAGFSNVLNYAGGMSAWDGTEVTGDSPRATARIIAAEGDVAIRRSRASDWESISDLPVYLYELDRVRTGYESGASLHFANGTTVLVNELSVVEIVGPPSSTGGLWRRLRVFLGEIFVTADPGGNQVDFETPNVIASVRGTEFTVGVFPDQLRHMDVSSGFQDWCDSDVFTTEVATVSGVVRVANELGAIDVSEGERVRVRHRERPGAGEKQEGIQHGSPDWALRLQRGK